MSGEPEPEPGTPHSKPRAWLTSTLQPGVEELRLERGTKGLLRRQDLSPGAMVYQRRPRLMGTATVAFHLLVSLHKDISHTGKQSCAPRKERDPEPAPSCWPTKQRAHCINTLVLLGNSEKPRIHSWRGHQD